MPRPKHERSVISILIVIFLYGNPNTINISMSLCWHHTGYLTPRVFAQKSKGARAYYWPIMFLKNRRSVGLVLVNCRFLVAT